MQYELERNKQFAKKPDQKQLRIRHTFNANKQAAKFYQKKRKFLYSVKYNKLVCRGANKDSKGQPETS